MLFSTTSLLFFLYSSLPLYLPLFTCPRCSSRQSIPIFLVNILTYSIIILTLTTVLLNIYTPIRTFFIVTTFLFSNGPYIAFYMYYCFSLVCNYFLLHATSSHFSYNFLFLLTFPYLSSLQLQT